MTDGVNTDNPPQVARSTVDQALMGGLFDFAADGERFLEVVRTLRDETTGLDPLGLVLLEQLIAAIFLDCLIEEYVDGLAAARSELYENLV